VVYRATACNRYWVERHSGTTLSKLRYQASIRHQGTNSQIFGVTTNSCAYSTISFRETRTHELPTCCCIASTRVPTTNGTRVLATRSKLVVKTCWGLTNQLCGAEYRSRGRKLCSHSVDSQHFYGTRRFTTEFTRALHLYLS
jgi:hypothetical protein